jgi:hypothetical protein
VVQGSTIAASGAPRRWSRSDTVLPMRDGLPKFKDFPAEFGGSGQQIAA